VISSQKIEIRNPNIETNPNDQKYNVPNSPDSDSSFLELPVFDFFGCGLFRSAGLLSKFEFRILLGT